MSRLPFATAVLWVLAGASAAKADFSLEYEARIAGPAFREPISLISTDAITLLHRLGVRPSSQPTTGSVPPPGQALGPRYEVRHVLRPLCVGIEGCPPHDFVVTQYLYPHAPERAWVFTPPGQRFWSHAAGGEFDVRSGWWGSEDLRGILGWLGVHQEVRGPAAPPAGGRESSYLWIWIMAASGLAASFLIAQRMRASRAVR
jgi:hypothetical protein